MRRPSEQEHSSRPSLTALRVAALRRSFDRVPWPNGRAGDEDRLAAALLDDAGALEPTRSTPEGERFRRYLSERTRFFDAFVVDAIAAGITQIVVVAAGYDGRALRYATAGVTFFEIDHPDTQAHKRRVLDELGISTDGMQLAAVDLSEASVSTALAGTSFDSSLTSAHLIEGLAAYLTAPDVERLLHDLRSVSAPASRLGISFPGRASPTAGSVALAQRVAALGEPIQLGVTGDAFRALVDRAGWTIVAGSAATPNLVRADAG
ncbi:MAG: hypothetical protein JWL72_4168 [Ilumatobacteraceae bacterium]|nr:hypothetical protein [Ilumatobacteraceae bacterium]MCU1390830.1 hypothetical protein [Ilumatobacteraceae bacterium]